MSFLVNLVLASTLATFAFDSWCARRCCRSLVSPTFSLAQHTMIPPRNRRIDQSLITVWSVWNLKTEAARSLALNILEVSLSSQAATYLRLGDSRPKFKTNSANTSLWSDSNVPSALKSTATSTPKANSKMYLR